MQFYSKTRFTPFVGYFSGVPVLAQKKVNRVFVNYHFKFPLSRVGGGRHSNRKARQRSVLHRSVFPAFLLAITMLASVSLLHGFPTSPPPLCGELTPNKKERQAKKKTNTPAPNTTQAPTRRHSNNIPNFLFFSPSLCVPQR